VFVMVLENLGMSSLPICGTNSPPHTVMSFLVQVLGMNSLVVSLYPYLLIKTESFTATSQSTIQGLMQSDSHQI